MTSKARMVVVDDNDAGRYVKTHILERAGYSVVAAANGHDAICLVKSLRPEIVLLDVKLPDMSGIEVCRQIKSLPHHTAVLLTSAASISAADRISGMSSGADSYLVEPMEADELLAAMKALLRMQRAERELRRLNETLEQKVVARTRELAEANQRLLTERQNSAKAEEALWHAQRLDAIGRLTGGIAHDFNNILTVVIGNLEMIESGMNQTPAIPPTRILKLVANGKHAAENCEHLVHQLLAFARKDTLRTETTNLSEVIRRLNNFIRRAIGEQVTCKLSLAANLWNCRVDPIQFEAALINLAVNARDAMPNGGVLQIETANIRVDAAGQAGMTSFPLPDDITPGDYVAIGVADSGVGMTEEVLSHAFEPFFTTKDIGKGSGLGLSQVFGFVKQSEGFLGIATHVDKGTQFGLFLPASREPATEASSGVLPEAELPKGHETVLVVEDNVMVLELVVELISELGYRVLQAHDGKAALDIIRSAKVIDLLFTDVVMPNQMSGIDLARTARQLRPQLKVLVTSGYTGRAAGANDVKREFPSLSKPYGRIELARRLREVLEPV